MTPSERAALVARIAVELHKHECELVGDHSGDAGNHARVERLTREAADWLAAAEYAVMGEPERHPARPDMCESCGGTEDDDAQAA